MGPHKIAKLLSVRQRTLSIGQNGNQQIGKRSLPTLHDRGLIANIYKELKKVDSREPNNHIFKIWGTELNREFSTEETQMAEKHLKKYSTSLFIREMEIKTTLRFHLALVRMAKIKNSDADKDVEKKEHSSIAGGIASLYNHSGNQSGGSKENWT